MVGAGEMSQQLRELAVQIRVQISSTHVMGWTWYHAHL